MRKILFLILASAISLCSMAQQEKLSGVVVDNTGSELPGARVQIKGTTKATITDENGAFSLDYSGSDAILEVSYISFETQDLKIGKKRVFKITMAQNNKDLNEVVVIGYGTMKKRDLSGSVGQIKGDDIMKGNPASSINQALEGRMAGVQVSQNDGAPGAGISITVRGVNSYSTNSQPLYIVDGIPFNTVATASSSANNGNYQTTNPLAAINPNDIASIEVLKDASATAIYGSRGANGVVIITTKRGTGGSEKIEFSSNFSTSHIGKTTQVLSSYDYANYINEEVMNAKTYSGVNYTQLPYPATGIWTYSSSNGVEIPSSGKYNPSPSDYLSPGVRTDQYGNTQMVGSTDWQKAIYQQAMTQEYNLNVSGGDSNGWHSFSGNYLDQNGIIKNSSYKRYNISANIGRKVHKWIELGLTTNFSNSTTNLAKTGSAQGVIRSALLFPPNYVDAGRTGNSDELNWLAANPQAFVDNTKDQVSEINIFNSAYLELKFTDYLTFRQNLGLSYSTSSRETYYNEHTPEGQAPNYGLAGQSDNWGASTTSESLLTFNKIFNKIHSVNVVAGTTYERDNYGSKAMTATNFPDDFTGDFDMSKGLNPGPLVSGRGQGTLLSFLARANYTLKDRYIFTASIRRDGSSKFMPKNKFANFASGAFAWRISEEKFIKDLNVFDNLKLRLSYGQTGNQGIGEYASIAHLGISNYPFGGTTTSGYADLAWNGPINPNLKWETTDQFNAGLDIAVLHNRVNLTVDAYHKKTNNLLQSIQIAPSTGFQQMQTNFGYVTNDGLEFQAKVFILENKSFKWNIDGNISFNKNTLGGLPYDVYANKMWNGTDQVFVERNGMPIGAIYGYVEDGLYNNIAEVKATCPGYANASDAAALKKVGEIKYRDLNHDGQITAGEDRTIIGNVNPKFLYGITNNFTYNNFTASIFIQGSYGNDIFNGDKMDITMQNGGNIPQYAYNTRWTASNTANAQWPKAISGNDRAFLISNRYVEDGSFARLKNINIGYNFKPKFQYIKLINVYASATNLFTLTKYSGCDPDVNSMGGDSNPARRGVDLYSYPTSMTFSLGLKVTF